MNEKFFRITHPKTSQQRAAEEAAKAAVEKEAAIKAAEEAAAAEAAAATEEATPLSSTPQRQRERGLAAPESVRSSPGVRPSPATSRGEFLASYTWLRPCWSLEPKDFSPCIWFRNRFGFSFRLKQKLKKW
jgi:hypothetical protein